MKRSEPTGTGLLPTLGSLRRLLDQLKGGTLDGHIWFDPYEGQNAAPCIDYNGLFWQVFQDYEEARLAPTDEEYKNKDMFGYIARLEKALSDQHASEYTSEELCELTAHVTHYAGKIRRYDAFKQVELMMDEAHETHCAQLAQKRRKIMAQD